MGQNKNVSLALAPTPSHHVQVDALLQASFACALLGHGKGLDDLNIYDGILALPERFSPLYGRERRLTLRGGSKEQQLVRMQALLLLHTVGY